MRGLRLSDAEEPLAEPGALWLDNDLRVRGRGACGLPHERPEGHHRGLALDCVGSFEYGRLIRVLIDLDLEAGTVCPERGVSGSLAAPAGQLPMRSGPLRRWALR
jgi:hypothetical protein